MKDQKEDIFHSSAYAKVQSGDTLGAASSQSYQVRVNINKNRQNIQGYGKSDLMMGARKQGPKAKPYTPPQGGAGGAAHRGAMPLKNPGISVKR